MSEDRTQVTKAMKLKILIARQALGAIQCATSKGLPTAGWSRRTGQLLRLAEVTEGFPQFWGCELDETTQLDGHQVA